MSRTFNAMNVVPIFDYSNRLCYCVTSRKLAKKLVQEHNDKHKDLRLKLYLAPNVWVVGGQSND